MDPISAIGVLASLSSLIKASDTLLGVAKSIRNAEKELRDLYNDLAIFQEALKGFDRVLRSRQTRHNISGEVIHNAVQEASATIEDLENRLGQIISSNVSSLRSLRWAQHKSSLKKVHERLREQSTMLQSFLALAHAFVILLFIDVIIHLFAQNLFVVYIGKHFLQYAANIRSSSKSTQTLQSPKIRKPYQSKSLLRPILQHYSQIAPHLPFEGHRSILLPPRSRAPHLYLFKACQLPILQRLMLQERVMRVENKLKRKWGRLNLAQRRTSHHCRWSES